LCIKGISASKIVDIPRVVSRDILNSKFILELKESIENIYESIVGISFLKETVEFYESVINKSLWGGNEKLASLMASNSGFLDKSMLCEYEDVEIQDDIKNVIIEYFKLNNKDINAEEFFCVGDLKSRKQMTFNIKSPGYSYSLVGKDDEKHKYELIKQLSNEITKYEQFVEYFTFIDSKFYVDLALCNVGRKYDEDIDVLVYLDKGMLFRKENIPVPGDDIVDSINSNLDSLFVPSESVNLQGFDNYSVVMPLEDYKKKINYRFCFDFYEEAEYDVICFKQKYLKQNMNSCFPSVLIFNEKPDMLKYEIRSKHCADVIECELKIN